MPHRYERPGYRRYVLLLLTLCYAFSFIDRQLLTILQESIKLDLGLSDTQLGILSGFVFSLFYVSAGIPLAKWADRGNRRNIVAAALGFWSVMTALSGLAVNYLQLVLARIGLGIGQAGGSPPAHSIISDIFPPNRRASAMAVYSVGINIGILFAFLLGGVLNQFFGWRVAFVVVGLPGILLALLIRLTVREPARPDADSSLQGKAAPRLPEVLKGFWREKSIRYLFVAVAFSALSGNALSSWLAPLFIRRHDLGTAELGLWLAMSMGVMGAVGTFVTGLLADRLGARNPKWYYWLPGMALLVSFPAAIAVITLEDPAVALWVNFLPGMFLMCYISPAVAILHTLVDPRVRAMASAILIFVGSIIGAGFGPVLVGVLSDSVFSGTAAESLQSAMLTVVLVATPIAVSCYLLAAARLDHHLVKEFGQ